MAESDTMTSAYSPEQIAEYLDYIQLPQSWRDPIFCPVQQRQPPPPPELNLDFLTVLHIHQISTIPYENLSLHYSRDKQISLDPQHLFEKFVRRKRGGYCMETSIFFNHVLRALGFQVYTAGVRIRLRKDGLPYGNFVGWHHMVNIVTLSSPSSSTSKSEPTTTSYMIDVGFGGDGATNPVPLIHAHEQTNLGTQSIRLIYDTIPEQVDQSKPLWIYQYRNSPVQPWNSYYAFPEVEFTESDFAILNHWLISHPDSFQRWTMLVIKFLRSTTTATNDGDGDDEEEERRKSKITGKVMLINETIKRNLGGKTEVVAVLKTETQRIEALNEWFQLQLGEEEKRGIKGHVTELQE